MTNLSYNKDTSEFQIEKEFHYLGKTYQTYALHQYYPKNRFPDAEVDGDIRSVRHLTWNFKDGYGSEFIATKIAQAIQAKRLVLSNACLVVIPASTVYKSSRRFLNFCSMLSTKLGIANGYAAITTTDHEQTKGHAGGNKIATFTFNPSIYQGKTVYLFDDVCTSGTSFEQVAEKLRSTGASSVIGIFLAKTISSYNSMAFFDPGDVEQDFDDLGDFGQDEAPDEMEDEVQGPEDYEPNEEDYY